MRNKQARAMWAVVLIAALALIGGSVDGVGAASASQTASPWSVSTQFPPTVYGVSAVDCVSTSHCEAVGGINASGFAMVTDTGGHQWTRQVIPSGLSLAGIVCTSATNCLAVGRQISSGGGVVLTTSDGGSQWVQRVVPKTTGFLDAVACPTASTCIAVGAGIVRSTNGGVRWTGGGALPTGVWYLGGITCTSSVKCVSVGTSNSPNPQGLTLMTIDSGVRWSEHGIGQSFTDSSLSAITCWADSKCRAVGYSDNGGLVLTSVNGGYTWVVASTPADVKNVGAVQCSSLNACVAVGTTDSTWSFLTSTDGGTTWAEHLAGQFSGGGLGLSCVTAAFCVASGEGSQGTPSIFLSQNGGKNWNAPQVPIGVGYLQSISCPSRLVCLTAGSTYNSGSTIMATHDGGTTWRNALEVDATQLTAISCPSTLDCMAVGNETTPSGGSVIGGTTLVTTNGGLTWLSSFPSVTAGFSLYGVSCPSSAHCVAIGESNSVIASDAFVTDDFGTTWTPEPLSHIGYSVSCPTVTACFTTAGLLHSTDGGTTWSPGSPPAGLSSLWSISCTSALNCSAAGGGGSGGSIITTSDGGATWSTEILPPATPTLYGISCLSPSTCDAVGESIVSTQDSGATWTLTPSPGDNLQAISCTTLGPCRAVGVDEVVTGGP
jgi:photosystem II stability/assembly factor-like uncharacterized protein